jgi:AcrR family transcriptional regulator
MKTKRTYILEAALSLFSTLGYSGTSTRMIASKAAVSEGLIFRHFTNKKGLLNALLEIAKGDIAELYGTALKLEHPKVFLKQLLSVPFQIKENNSALWRFVYSHQWFEPKLMKLISTPIQKRVVESFKNIGVSDPQTEADSFLIFLEGLTTQMLLKKTSNSFSIAEHIARKFNL